MAIMMGLASQQMTNDSTLFNLPAKQSKPDWERKKCKSCSLFPCRGSYQSPLSQACEEYNKRKR